jgi:ABC-type branched-subunit amino acid transport system ATPase component/ABC-type branched-subunit amino acid transport system permease subunit
MRLRGLLIAAALIVVASWLLPPFYVTLANYVGLASIVVLGLVLLGGAGGLMSFGQAAFVGVAAYTTAYLTLAYGLSPWLTLPIGLALTGILAFVLGALTLRLTGHYLPIGTLAWGISLYYVFANVAAFGKHDGLADIPGLSLFGHALNSGRGFFYLIWAVVVVAVLSIENILDSRFGRAVRSGGRTTPMAEAFGIDTARVSMAIFVYAALLAAMSGWLYAHFLRFVNPTPFGLSTSIEYFFMAVIGGATSTWGAIVGALFYIVGKQWLQTLIPAITGRVGQLDIIVFGVAIIAILHYARQGLVPFFLQALSRPAPKLIDPRAKPLPRRAQPRAGSELLRVSQVEKRFGGLTAVNKVSFEISAGEIVALIGPNGAGKTTMFNLITGVAQRTAGDVFFCGRSLQGQRSRQVLQHGIARTFQHALLRPHMSVLENVALGAHTRGRAGIVRAALRLNRTEERQLLAEAYRQLQRVGLDDVANGQADSLSLGKQRIVEIARALAADPQLLLLDEPAAGLRYEEKVVLAQLLASLRGEGMTLLLVEHDMDFVMNLVDRLVVMDFGEKIAEGRPEEVQANPRVIGAYLGSLDECLPLKQAV